MTPRIQLIDSQRTVFVTQREAGDILGVTDRTIRNMLADGRLRGYRIGSRNIRLKLNEVESALQPIRA